MLFPLGARVVRNTAAALFGIIVSVGAWTQAFALDPHRVIDAYGHDSWTRQNNLPGEAVYQILQTSDGYLWLRLSDRLVRFDGVNFVPIDSEVGGELVDEPVRAIARGIDGDLLVRGRERILRYHDGRFSEYRPKAPLPDAFDRYLFESHDGRLWVGADNHLYLAKDQGFLNIIKSSTWITSMLEDHNGNLWIGAYTGLYKYHDHQFTVYPTDYFSDRVVITPLPGTPPNTPPPTISKSKVKQINALLEDRDGTLWVGTHGNGLFKFINGKLVADESTAALANQDVTALAQDRDGNLWVGTDSSGVFRRADGKWSSFTAQDGLKDNSILSIYEDREGSIWIGTRSGLDRFRDTPFIAFTAKQGLASDEAYTVVESPDHSIYVTTAAGLSEIKQGQVTSPTDHGLNGAYGPLYRDHDGSLWFATSPGLSRIKDGAAASLDAIQQLQYRFISAIASDDQSLLFTLMGFRLFRLQEGKLAPYLLDGKPTPFTKDSNIYIFCMHAADDGAIWLGTTDGLYRLKKGEPIAAAKQKGFNFPITNIYDDHKGSLWITGDVSGLFRMRVSDGQITPYQKANGLPDGEITQVITDRHGDFWLSTSRGIWTVSRTDLDEVAAGQRQRLRFTIFDTFDGMKTNEAATNRHTPAACLASDGRLWFTTRKGVVVVDPDHLNRNELVPPVAIEKLITDRQRLLPETGAVLQAGTSKLEFHYSCLSLLVPDRVKFRYKLEGYDQEWVDAGSRRAAYYTNLPPGDYRFRVQACNNDGVWNEAGASMAFYLTPRFVQTKWFIALCVLAVLLLGVVSLNLRTRHLRTRQKELEGLVDQRTQSLREQIQVREKAEEELRGEIVVRKRAEAEAERIHKELLVASHQAGMAEIATGVLHNIGNALNSVNVSASLVANKVRSLRVATLSKIASTFQEHAHDIAAYLTTDDRGKQLPNYLVQVSTYLVNEQKELLGEMEQLATGIEHIKAVVARQQDYARLTGVTELADVNELIEDALTINSASLKRHEIEVTRESTKLPLITVEKHKLLQILVNLITNAKDACSSLPPHERRVVLKAEAVNDRLRITVHDNGMGIAPEALTQIFGQGYTTKKNGHGFGLHSSILAAKDMGGSLVAESAGLGKGATFILELPVKTPPPKPA